MVTPPSSATALTAALSQDPNLTSLPHPRADVIAPAELTHTSGTAEIFRLPEIQSRILGDFIIVPCDLLCELPGESLIESWLVEQSLSGNTSSGPDGYDQTRSYLGLQRARKDGLGVWYETKGDDFVKGTETDFMITGSEFEPIVRPPSSSIRTKLSKLLFTCTSDTLKDNMQEQAGLQLRTGLVRKHGKIRLLTTHRAAHIYIFPHWTLKFFSGNDQFDNISEDVIGWWARSAWQEGLGVKLHMDEAFLHEPSKSKPHQSSKQNGSASSFAAPGILTYTHPPDSSLLIRRVDTPALLLSTSLYLAASLDPERPFAHRNRVATDAIEPHTTIDRSTTLIARNTTVAKHCTIKSSCIGANCSIAEGTRITGTILMDDVKIETKVTLQGCILGRRCIIGNNAKLDGCEVQEGFRVREGTVGTKGEKFCVFEGLENGLDQLSSDNSVDADDQEGP